MRFSPWSTSGSQKCIGAIPIFKASAMVASAAEVGLSISSKLHSPRVQAFVMLANNNKAEAVACVRKYFVAASTARGWC